MVPIYKIRVNYKSGRSEEFECLSFEAASGGYKWKSYGSTRPILLAVDVEQIESVWQLDVREVPDFPAIEEPNPTSTAPTVH